MCKTLHKLLVLCRTYCTFKHHSVRNRGFNRFVEVLKTSSGYLTRDYMVCGHFMGSIISFGLVVRSNVFDAILV